MQQLAPPHKQPTTQPPQHEMASWADGSCLGHCATTQRRFFLLLSIALESLISPRVLIPSSSSTVAYVPVDTNQLATLHKQPRRRDGILGRLLGPSGRAEERGQRAGRRLSGRAQRRCRRWRPDGAGHFFQRTHAGGALPKRAGGASVLTVPRNPDPAPPARRPSPR